MPTNRTPLRRRTKFTPRAIALFRRCMELVDRNERLQSDPEFCKLSHDLGLELGLNAAQCPRIILPTFESYRDPATPCGRWQQREGPRMFRELCEAAGIELGDDEAEEK